MGKKTYNYITKGFSVDGVHYTVKGKTEEEALAKKLAKLRQLEEGRLDSNMTVRQWAAQWYETYIAHRKITAKSKADYKRRIDRDIVPVIGALKLRKVTPARLQQILNEHEGESASNVGKLHMTLRAIFSRAYLSRLLSFDPSEGLEIPSTSQNGHRSLTEAERAALCKVAAYETWNGKPNRSGPWLMLLLRCGLRPGETAALRKVDVDLKGRVLHVRQGKESGSARVKSTKTKAGVRDVPIPEDLVPWLERQLADNASPWLYTQKDKKTPLSETAMRRRWETVKKYMDIELGAQTELVKLPGARRRSLVITEHALAEDLDLYDLRHTYCTDLEAAGVPINVAKTLMGHADIATTANIYTHASDASLAAARELINVAEARKSPQP